MRCSTLDCVVVTQLEIDYPPSSLAVIKVTRGLTLRLLQITLTKITKQRTNTLGRGQNKEQTDSKQTLDKHSQADYLEINMQNWFIHVFLFLLILNVLIFESINASLLVLLLKGLM